MQKQPLSYFAQVSRYKRIEQTFEAFFSINSPNSVFPIFVIVFRCDFRTDGNEF
jgi:hypothetical protein